MTVEIDLTNSHPSRPYVTHSHTHTRPLTPRLSQPNPTSGWIRHETNVSTWFIQLYLQVSYDFFLLEIQFFVLHNTPTRVSRSPMIGQLINLLTCFTQPNKVKTTQQVTRNRGQRCGDIELSWLSTLWMCPWVIEYMNYLTDLDRPLNETDTDKIHQYRSDYNNFESSPGSHTGKLFPVFLQFQEFSLGNQPLTTVTVMWCSPHWSSPKLVSEHSHQVCSFTHQSEYILSTSSLFLGVPVPLHTT
jgi:hypothetical protein